MLQNKNLATKLHKVWQLFSHSELKSRVSFYARRRD